jgi:hypothetical protein
MSATGWVKRGQGVCRPQALGLKRLSPATSECAEAAGGDNPEGTILGPVSVQGPGATPGSKSVACKQSRWVNVGDPDRPSMDGSIG